MDKEALKRTALMADIVTLVAELSSLHEQQVETWAMLTPVQKEHGRRLYEELEQTICTKLVAVKYFQSLGDSFIKVTAAAEGRRMYLEIVTVYEGSHALSFPAEFEFQVHPITGWLPMFRSCQPATASEYGAAVDLAIEKGAVVV